MMLKFIHMSFDLIALVYGCVSIIDACNVHVQVMLSCCKAKAILLIMTMLRNLIFIMCFVYFT